MPYEIEIIRLLYVVVWYHVLLCCVVLGCRDGAVVRALASHQCGPGSIPRLGVIMWVEFVDSLRCTERFLSGYSSFPSPQKRTIDLICIYCKLNFS